MHCTVLVSAMMLALQVPDPPPPGPIDQPAAASRAKPDTDQGEAMAEYAAMNRKTPRTAAAQWRLGLWCEKHGLKPEALVHFAEVLRLDPSRDLVWKKLGFKKVDGRWMTSAQIAEKEEQEKADKIWAPKLKKIHRDIHAAPSTERGKAARNAIAAITDPRAVLPVYREFGGGGQVDQLIAIRILGQIDRAISSKVLAMFAVYGDTPLVRQRAVETLRGRTPEDFQDLFVALLIDPIHYEVKPVGGPGSPGAIFIEGKKANTARFYAPPAAPRIGFMPGDIMTFDQMGRPAIGRPVNRLMSGIKQGVPGSKTLVKETDTTLTQYATISPYQLQLEAQKGAIAAQAQLQNDVAQLKRVNMLRKQYNDQIIAAAKDATGKDFGTTPKEWREGVAAAQNSPKAQEPTQKPTIPEFVPLAYNPVFMPSGIQTQTVIQTRVVVDS